MTISSPRDLQEFVMEVIEEQKTEYKGSLDEYLRSVWASIQRHRNETPSYGLFAQIIRESFLARPAVFEDEWMMYKAPPSDLHSRAVSSARSSSKDGQADFECLKSEVLFLIAELKRMKPLWKDESRYFGVQSTTGHTWYNWDPSGYLECATAGLISHSKGGLLTQHDTSDCNWALFAFILELGRIYE